MKPSVSTENRTPSSSALGSLADATCGVSESANSVHGHELVAAAAVVNDQLTVPGMMLPIVSLAPDTRPV
jgi:hypothetical protein